MKNYKSLIIASLIICGAVAAVPAYGQPEQAAGEEKDDTVFQKMSDVIHGEYEVKTVPFKKIGIFQKMADGIGTVSRS
ncbi:MAG: hypothetical protein WCY36_01625 [Candidatus Omnitrophota bacterium]